MNKKAFLSAIIIFALLASLVAGLHTVEVAKANWIFPPTKPATTPPSVTMLSPVNGSTYREGFVLDFNLSSPSWARGPGKPSGNIIGLAYKIDDQLEQAIDVPDPFASRPDEYRRTVPIALNSALYDGVHSLKIISYCETYYVPENSTTYNVETYKFSSVCAVVNFNIAVNPQIIFLSPENRTYNTSEVLVNFTIDRPVLFIRYSIDGQVNVTMSENTILTGLTDGSHNLVIYANDTAGNIGKSETVFFTVDTTTPTPKPSNSPKQQPTLSPSPTASPSVIFVDVIDYGTSPLPCLLGIAVIVTIVILGVLVYFKKRRR